MRQWRMPRVHRIHPAANPSWNVSYLAGPVRWARDRSWPKPVAQNSAEAVIARDYVNQAVRPFSEALCVNDESRRWIGRGTILAAGPTAQVPCRRCQAAMLSATDQPIDVRHIERHLRCPACGAYTSVRIWV